MKAQPRFMVLVSIGVLIGLAFCVLRFPGVIKKAEIQESATSRPVLAKAASTVGGDLLATQQARAVETYGMLPLSFEVNRGQTADPVRFLVRGQGYSMFLTQDEAVLALRSQKPEWKTETRNWKLETENWHLGRGKAGIRNESPAIAATFAWPDSCPKDLLPSNRQSPIINRKFPGSQSRIPDL